VDTEIKFFLIPGTYTDNIIQTEIQMPEIYYRLQHWIHVSWSNKKQPIVSLSSTESEYKALCAATCEVVSLRRLLQDVGEEQRTTIIKCDNQSSIKLQIIQFPIQGQSMLMLSFILFEKRCSLMTLL
jgi:hypothetical protein